VLPDTKLEFSRYLKRNRIRRVGKSQWRAFLAKSGLIADSSLREIIEIVEALAIEISNLCH